MASDIDAHLLVQFVHGDESAFEQLFLRYYSQVYRIAYGVLGQREAAEDLAQETFLALYNQPPHLGTGGSLLAWLCRVALNRSYNAIRGERRAQARIERAGRLETPPTLDPDDTVIRAEERDEVRAVIATLPERQAQLLLLRYAGLAYAEIAAVISVAPGSVGTLLARAEKAFVAAYERMHLLHEIGNDHARML